MVGKLRKALLAAALVGVASQLGCMLIAAGAIGTGIGNAVRGEPFLGGKEDRPHDEWLLPDGGKPVRTPDSKKAEPPSNAKPVPSE
jgi:hypothetical protein